MKFHLSALKFWRETNCPPVVFSPLSPVLTEVQQKVWYEIFGGKKSLEIPKKIRQF